MGSQARIHILGVGNLGRLIAHALANKPNPPPVTLLFHRPTLLEEWERAGRRVEITTNGVSNFNGHFEVEIVRGQSPGSLAGGPIANLIVTTKTYFTSRAISAVQHRLTGGSTVLFCQNGMGTIDEVTTAVFPDPTTRPHYLATVVSHGVYSQGPFRSVHAGQVDQAVGHVDPNAAAAEAQYLVDQVTGAPVLAATEVAPTELLARQLDKLVVNDMINPLAAVFRCRNGELFPRAPIARLMRVLLAEASQVLRSLPEVRADPAALERFSAPVLEEKVLGVARKTAGNTSSMLQDVQAGRETEIDYITGWIVRKAKEAGVPCRNHEILVELVKGTRSIGVEDIERIFPDAS